MKNETLEDELKLLKIDIQNLKKEVRDIAYATNSNFEFYIENLKRFFIVNGKNFKFSHPYKCTKCEGTGKVYIPPISDCGQSDTCVDCSGTGKIWI